MPTVRDLLNILQQITPDDLAEDWDNVGLLVGEPGQDLHRILIALDPACALIDLARNGRYDCIITHHPVIFRPLKALCTDTPIGRFIVEVAKSAISVIACHTNLDSIQQGISDSLASALALTETRPLMRSARECDPTCGLGRIGVYQEAITPTHFLDMLRKACKPPWILEAGPRPKQITTAAVCGGSCSDLAEIALLQGAEVFVTAEIKHSVARWAEDAGLWLLDAGHFATENPSLLFFRSLLLHSFAERGWDVQIDMADQQSPLQLV